MDEKISSKDNEFFIINGLKIIATIIVPIIVFISFLHSCYPQVDPIFLVIIVIISWIFICIILTWLNLFKSLKVPYLKWRKKKNWIKVSAELLALLDSAVDAELLLVDTRTEGAIGRVVSQYFQDPVISRTKSIDTEFKGFHSSLSAFKNWINMIKKSTIKLKMKQRHYRSVVGFELKESIEELVIFHNEFFEWSNDVILRQLNALGVSCPGGSITRQEFISYKTNLDAAFNEVNKARNRLYQMEREIDDPKSKKSMMIVHIGLNGKEPSYDLPQ